MPKTQSRFAGVDPIALDDLIGVGHSRKRDCNWLARECARRFGLAYPDIETPSDSQEFQGAIEEAARTFYTKVTDPGPGAVAIFRSVVDGKERWHIGTILDRVWMVTTLEATGVIKCRYRRSPWSVYLVGYYARK